MRSTFRIIVLAAVVTAIAAPGASAAGKVSTQDFHFAVAQPAASSQAEQFTGGVQVATGDLNGDGGTAYRRVRFGDLVVSS